MGRGKTVSQLEKAHILAMIRRGESNAAIASDTGRSTDVVRRLRKQLNAATQPCEAAEEQDSSDAGTASAEEQEPQAAPAREAFDSVHPGPLEVAHVPPEAQSLSWSYGHGQPPPKRQKTAVPSLPDLCALVSLRMQHLDRQQDIQELDQLGAILASLHQLSTARATRNAAQWLESLDN